MEPPASTEGTGQTAGAGPTDPSDPTDPTTGPTGPTDPTAASPAATTDAVGWEPGVPSLRDHLPSIIGGAVVPLAVYYLVRKHVHSDAQALIIAGVFPAAWILIQFVRQRRVDPVGAIVLAGFAVGIITSTILGGNAYVLKVRDSAFTVVFGLVCLLSLLLPGRPAIFYVGRYLSAGNEPDKVAAFNLLHDLPIGRHVFRVLTAVWGVGLIIEASTRLVLAAVLPTGIFLAASPAISAVCLGSMFLFTVQYTKRTRALSLALSDDGGAPPTIPLA
jgi:hypothetical protein